MKPVISHTELFQHLQTHFGITETQIAEAGQLQIQLKCSVDKALATMGLVDEEQQAAICAFSHNGEVLPASASALGPEKISLLEQEVECDFILQQGGVPIDVENDQLTLAVSTVENWSLLDYLRLLPMSNKLLFCHAKQLQLLKEQYELNQQLSKTEQQVGDGEIDKLRELAEGAPTISLVNQLIAKGVKLGASDLHIEPVDGRYRARYRVDGILHEGDPIPLILQLPVISRIKILSGMDIAEKRRPQDGKIETRVARVELDIRCSALPLGSGESMVMRFLIKNAVKFELATLGYESDLTARIEDDLKKTSGVILMTGPTGSGKTTSLYSYLNQLNRPEVKIITLEDPIEYKLNGINQVQINSDIGFDFAKGLRSIVRQDPDIIMIGEIRDNETARIALQSALTGHLVFSTVHTNDAATAYTRLLDLGVQEYLLNAALVSVLAQRLVRKLCSCATLRPDAAELVTRYQLNEVAERYSVNQINLKQPNGCEQCGNSGFQGRVAILEYLPCDNTIKQLPKDENFFLEAGKHMRACGLRSLREDGYLKAVKGQTTLEEVLRVAG